MLKSSFVWAFALGAALLVGCSKEETTPTPAPTPSSPPKQPQAGAGAGEEMKKADAAVSDTANKGADTAAKTAGDTAKGVADAAKTGTDTAAKAVSAADTEANTLMAQVNQYIKDKKFDDADAALKKLEGMQDKLPESVKTQLPTARKAIDAGKALLGGSTPAAPSGAEVPKVPGLSK